MITAEALSCRTCGHVFSTDEAVRCKFCHTHKCPRCGECLCAKLKSVFKGEILQEGYAR